MSTRASGWGCLFAVCLLSSASALPLEEEIASRVKDLGAREWKTREAAEKRLLEIGDAALGALKQAARGQDAEVRVRAAALIERLDRGTPEERVRVAKLVETLMTTRDVAEGSKAFKELKGMGEPGLKILRSLFPARANEKPRPIDVEWDFARRTFHRGKPIRLQATLRNNGTEPAWIRPIDFLPEKASREEVLRVCASEKDGDPSFTFLCLKPGDNYPVTIDIEWMMDEIGRYDFSMERLGIGGNVLDGMDMDEEIARLNPHLERRPDEAGLPRRSMVLLRSGEHELFVIPDPEAGWGVKPISVTLSAGAPEAAAGQAIPFTIEIRGEGEKPFPILGLASGAPSDGFWVALVDGKGEAVRMTSYLEMERLAEEMFKRTGKPDRPSVARLKKGETLCMKGEIQAPSAQGEYRLIAGYHREGPGVPVGKHLTFPGEMLDFVERNGDKVVPTEVAAWKGDVASNDCPIRVKGHQE